MNKDIRQVAALASIAGLAFMALTLPSSMAAEQPKTEKPKSTARPVEAKTDLVARFDMPDFNSPGQKLTELLNKTAPQYSLLVGAGILAVTMNPQLGCIDVKGPISVLVYAITGDKGVSHEIAVVARRRPDLKTEDTPKKIKFRNFSFNLRQSGDLIILATSKYLLDKVGKPSTPDAHGADLSIELNLNRMSADAARIYRNTRASILQDSFEKSTGLNDDKMVETYLKLKNVKLDHFEKLLQQLSKYDLRLWLASDELRVDQTMSAPEESGIAGFINSQPKLSPGIRYPSLDADSVIMACSMDLSKAIPPLTALAKDALLESTEEYDSDTLEHATKLLQRLSGDFSMSTAKLDGNPISCYFIGLHPPASEAMASIDFIAGKIFSGGIQTRSVNGQDLRFCPIPYPNASLKENACYWPVDGGMAVIAGTMDLDSAVSMAGRLKLSNDKAFEDASKNGRMGVMCLRNGKSPDTLLPIGHLTCGGNAASLELRLSQDALKEMLSPVKPETKKQADGTDPGTKTDTSRQGN